MIEDIEDYFRLGCGRCARFATADCSARVWAEGLAELRRICRDEGLEERVKWGHPCYIHAGRNIAIIGAMRSDFRLSFFDAALLSDPEGLLERQGPNTKHPDCLRFTDAGQVLAREPAITAFLREAMTHAEAGRRAPRAPSEVAWPEELIEALDADPELAEAFHRLTPGRQKSYAFDLNRAKTTATRIARIDKFRPKILAGKGALDR